MLDLKNYLKNLKDLVSLNTIEKESLPLAPFGEENKKALSYVFDLAKSFGFKVYNHDGYAVEVVLEKNSCSENTDTDLNEIGIMGHLDIVPAGDGWDSNPFELTEINGTYFGRGVSDDKGPILLAFYALKELKESGAIRNRTFRLFFGANEETGWKDAKYLQENVALPKYGFSPDGDFPLSYAEKGVYIAKFNLEKLNSFTGIKGGSVINAVCDSCEVIYTGDNLDKIKEIAKKHNIKFTGNKFTAIGKAAHGAHPELGVNAIKLMLEFLLDCKQNVKNALDYLFYNKSGLTSQKTKQGFITISPNLIEENEQNIIISCDIRLPAPFTQEIIEEKLSQFGITYQLIEKHDTRLVEEDGEFVKTLLNAYNSVTGENQKPISICGSTFARVFEKGVAFGPSFMGIENDIHKANEKVSKKQLLTSYEIYKKALFDLAKL